MSIGLDLHSFVINSGVSEYQRWAQVVDWCHQVAVSENIQGVRLNGQTAAVYRTYVSDNYTAVIAQLEDRHCLTTDGLYRNLPELIEQVKWYCELFRVALPERVTT